MRIRLFFFNQLSLSLTTNSALFSKYSDEKRMRNRQKDTSRHSSLTQSDLCVMYYLNFKCSTAMHSNLQHIYTYIYSVLEFSVDFCKKKANEIIFIDVQYKCRCALSARR